MELEGYIAIMTYHFFSIPAKISFCYLVQTIIFVRA